LGEARKQAGKKEGGLGEGIFARLLFGFAKNFSEDDGLFFRFFITLQRCSSGICCGRGLLLLYPQRNI